MKIRRWIKRKWFWLVKQNFIRLFPHTGKKLTFNGLNPEIILNMVEIYQLQGLKDREIIKEYLYWSEIWLKHYLRQSPC